MGISSDYKMFYLNKMAKEVDQVIGEEKRKEVMECCSELTSKKPKWQRAKTMRELMENMEKKLEENQLIEIRERCACKPKKFLSELKKIKKETGDIKERIEIAAQTNFAGKCSIIDDKSYKVIFELKECVCGMISGQKNPVPLSWCHCCKGHVQWMYENLLDKKFNMELISSVASEGEDCVFLMREV